MRIEDSSPRSTDRTPWYYRDGEVHDVLHDRACECIDRDGRRSKLRRLEDVYTGRRPDDTGQESELKVVKNMMLSVFAQLSRAQPATEVISEGGDIEVQERARFCTSWLAGKRIDIDTDCKARKVLLDGGVFGSGAIASYVDPDDGIAEDVVWIGDLGVEQREQENRVFHTLYRAITMDREVAKARWPKHAEALGRASFGFSKSDASRTTDDEGTDLITLVEAWHLTVGKKKGRHAVVASTCTLQNDEWDSKIFPVTFFHWTWVPSATFAMGLVESATPGQAALDRLTDKVNDSFENGCTGRYCVSNEANIPDEKITDTPREILRFDGQIAPTYLAADPISEQYRDQQRQLIEWMYQLEGVSQLAAQSMKPEGLDSGEAIRAYNNVESAYWYPQSSDWEAFNVKLDRAKIRCAEEIMESHESLKDKLETLGLEKGELTRLGYEQARYDESSMQLRTLPVAKLSTSAAGKIADVKELFELGVVDDPAERRELVGLPDRQRSDDLALAGRRIVQLQVAECLKGNPQEVDPSVIDLAYAAKFAQQALVEHILRKRKGAVDVLRTFQNGVQSEIDKLAKKQQEAAANVAPAANGIPPMPPAMPPAPALPA
jgi:hypothetical protein